MIDKQFIIDLIKNQPKGYSTIIKHTPELIQWVDKNTKCDSNRPGSRLDNIYSATSGKSNICPNDNQMHVSRFKDGWVFCGESSVCKCTRDSISESMKSYRKTVTEERQADINTTRETTMVTKYGYKYNSQRPEIKKILSKPKIAQNVHDILTNYEWMNKEYNDNKRTLSHIADELGVYYGTVGWYCIKHGFEIRQRTNYSMEEMEILNYIESLNIECVHSDWKTLTSREIDIYVPSAKLGIEMNGLHWHSFNPYCNHTKSEFENRFKHMLKPTLAEEVGINLIQFTDFEWNTKTDICKSIITSNLKSKNQIKIFANKCIISIVSKDEEREFLNKNHIQGFLGSNLALGLYYNNELVMLMSFGKPRYNIKYDIELLRLCSKMNTIIAYGATRLFKHAIKHYYVDKSVISYCDMSKFSGKIYETLGFRLLNKKIEPSYFWTDSNNVISRYKTMKQELAKWLPSFDKNKTESQNMFDAKYRRYYDAGQATWVFDNTVDKI